MGHRRGIGKSASAAAALWLLTAAFAFAQQYNVIDLGTLPSRNMSDAFDINAFSQIAATAPAVQPSNRAFLWQSGQITELGTLVPGNPLSAWSFSADINDSGQIVGTSNYSGAPIGWGHAFVWQNGVMTDLGGLDGLYSSAASINNAGQVVGSSGMENGQVLATLWQNGGMINLGTLGGNALGNQSWASSINSAGTIVGGSYAPGEFVETHAFIWQNGVMTDLGTLWGPGAYSAMSQANAINDNGQIVGYSIVYSTLSSPLFRAAIWDNAAVVDLGGAPEMNTFASDINNNGLVVGYKEVVNTGPKSAVMWTGGNMFDLNSLIPANSGWTLLEARGVNDRGEIVGLGIIDGESHAFLLTAIPEPSGQSLLLVGGLGVLMMRWLKSRKR